MADLSGFDWASAPLKWRLLDISYLVLDLGVVIGLLIRPHVGLVLFVVAAASQIVLYTVFRNWVIDVPVEFARSNDQIAYLWTLVVFHLATLLIVGTSFALRRWHCR